jgi:hypothetical protein
VTREVIVVTWYVAPAQTEVAIIESWCRGIAAGRGDVLVQISTGRGRLAGGRGAVIVDAAPGRAEPDRPAWAEDVLCAEFHLRQVNAPDEQPNLATTPAMLLTRTFAPPDMRDEFREWLQVEHSQRQLDVSGNNWYLGYEEIGGRESFMNFWGIDDPAIADGPEWDRARLTPWRERMVPAMAGMDRGFYRPIAGVSSS